MNMNITHNARMISLSYDKIWDDSFINSRDLNQSGPHIKLAYFLRFDVVKNKNSPTVLFFGVCFFSGSFTFSQNKRLATRKLHICNFLQHYAMIIINNR